MALVAAALTMVAVIELRANSAFCTLLRVSVNVSLDSSTSSPATGTRISALELPAGMVSVPATGV